MFGGQLNLDLPLKSREIVRTVARLSSGSKRSQLLQRYSDKLVINPELNRALVSFQANKDAPFYRWLKYKEGFSSGLVEYFLERFKGSNGTTLNVLDPFAGAGTTLTTATKLGWQATGIELLPVGLAAVHARLFGDTVNLKSFEYYLNCLKKCPLDSSRPTYLNFPHLRITKKAFPEKTERALSNYHAFLETIKDEKVRYLFRFACLSILEDVSYTRKDGQYLRWDNRSDRLLKSDFNKGTIYDFRSTILCKLRIMLEDMKYRNQGAFSRNINIIKGSCLTELSRLPDTSFEMVITSPPYCNRYDYTRTYALELAFLGYGEEAVKNLRQSLLSSTVENKTKRVQLTQVYRSRNLGERYESVSTMFSKQEALHEILSLLYKAQEKGELNNNNIPAMVENYFFEMNLVIYELSRVLAPGGQVVMINDNVQYHGEEVPVDLILSDFATSAGLLVDQIWVLPRGKGNSSQQMGIHGRNELRKCVYVWSKPLDVQ